MKHRVFLLAVFIAIPCWAATPTTRQVNLLSMGDWGNNGPNQRRVAAAMRQYIHSAAPRKFDAMLTAGDNFYVRLENIFDPKWKTMFEEMYEPETFDFPFYVALGNHDYEQSKYLIEMAYAKANPQSRWKLPARWYRVDIPLENPLVTVLVLDSDVPLLGKVDWEAEMQWLRAELAKPRTAKWLICTAHHPLLSNGDHGDNGVLQRNWIPLFNQAKVDFFICGHDHDLQHLESDEITPSLLLVGGGGATTRPMRVDKRGPFSKAAHGFADLELRDELARVRLVGLAGVLHEITRTPGGNVTVVHSVPSDVAIPRTVRSITRDRSETRPTTAP